MGRKQCWLAAVVLLALSVGGCDALGDDDTSGVVTLSGQVLNATTNNPVEGAFVRIQPMDAFAEADAEGRYEVDVEIDSTMNLSIVATRDGFDVEQVGVLAVAGRVVDVPTLRLRRMVAEEQVSGQASNILLLGQSSQSIGVRESGSEEVARIDFMVTDSVGRPLTLDNGIEVSFSLGQQPGGAEFIFPEQAQTDNNGKVSVNLSSGTRAGVVQILAEARIGGRVIRSLPVAVTIHGGLPDQPHFTLGPKQFNFPGRRIFGLTNEISVIVGDKYGNPVKPGTAVYFTTSHGVIEGSTLTSETGGGGVDLISANPLPPTGIGVVTATTADENQAAVTAETPVLFSGAPVIAIDPPTAALGQTYTVTLTDDLGNPLAPGTTLRVKVEGTKVKAVGNTDVILDDTIIRSAGGTYEAVTGPGITRFTFSAVEDQTVDETGTPTVESIAVAVGGPNGALEIVMTPGGVSTRTDGAVVERLGETVRVSTSR